jgi:hypothetical protein
VRPCRSCWCYAFAKQSGRWLTPDGRGQYLGKVCRHRDSELHRSGGDAGSSESGSRSAYARGLVLGIIFVDESGCGARSLGLGSRLRVTAVRDEVALLWAVALTWMRHGFDQFVGACITICTVETKIELIN